MCEHICIFPIFGAALDKGWCSYTVFSSKTVHYIQTLIPLSLLFLSLPLPLPFPSLSSTVPPPPPQPMNMMITQNGPDSVRVSWTIDTSNAEATFMIDVCYTPSGGSEMCLGEGSTLPKIATFATISGLEVGVNYAFSVVSVTSVDRNASIGRSVVLSPCSGGMYEGIV